MAINKKIKTEIWKVYDTWLHGYLNGDITTYDYYLDEEYHFIGSTNNEEFLSKKDTTNFFKETAEQFAGKCELRNETKIIEDFGGLVFITHVFDAWFKNEQEWAYYGRFRFSSVLKKTGEGWRFIYQHFSVPDSKTNEGETIGFDKVNAENLELKDAIKRRTFELEQKNRKLEVEAALERVRSRTMAMQHSDELQEISFLLDEQVRALGIKTWGCAFNIYGENNSKEWFGNKAGVLHTYTVPRKGIFKHYYQKGQQGESILVKEFSGDECIAHYDYMSTLPVIGDVLKNLKETNDGFPTYQIDHVVYFKYGYLLFITRESVPDAHDVFKRFAKVFEQTYTRFLDLQKAETQAREAQIEAAIERVRSRSMAMHKSEELQNVVKVIFDQLMHLNINADHAGIVVDFAPKNDFHFWVADNQDIPSKITVPYLDLPWDKQYTEAKKKDIDFFATHLNFEEKNSFYKKLLPHIEGITKKAKNFYLNCPGLAASTVVEEDIGLYIENFSGTPFTDEENSILKRFGSVFQQSYTRFLDLKKAENQAREAQIETALERIRSQSMAMQSSNDLSKVTTEMFTQLRQFGGDLFATGIVFCDKHDGHVEQWHSIPNAGMTSPFLVPIDLDYIHQYRYNEWKKGTELFSIEIPSDFIEQHFTDIFNLPSAQKALKELEDLNTPMPEVPPWEIDYGASFKHGYILASSLQHFDESEILPRFAKVFEQTYTRFLDLQKSEKQTREAQINLAVERVRAKALAMHQSEEIMEVVAKLKDEVMALDIPDVVAATIFLNEGKDKVRMWDLSTLQKDSNGFQIPFDITFKLKKRDPNLYVKRVWDNPKDYFVDIQNEKDLKRIVVWLRENNQVDIAKEVEQHAKTSNLKRLYHAVKKLNNGKLAIDLLSKPSDEMETILTKMGAAFDLAYKRFEDLQNAEQQAKEAQIEAALEKVRTVALSLQKSDDMLDIAKVLFEQLQVLGFDHMRNAIIDVHVDDDNFIDYDYSDNMKGTVTKMRYSDDPTLEEQFRQVIASKDKLFELVLEGQELQDLIDMRIKNGEAEDPRLRETDQVTYNMYSFGNGAIGISNFGILSIEEKDILKRFRNVFTFAYNRYSELAQKEAQARKTQIDVALEKVRNRTMAMQHSDELPEAANNLFIQVQELGIPAWSAGYCIWENDGKRSAWCSMSSEGTIQNAFSLPTIGEGYDFYTPIAKGEKFHVSELGGEALVKHYDFMKTLPGIKEIFAGFDAKGIALPTFQIFHIVYFSHGYLMFITYEDVTSEWEIFKRFGKVFDQTYTRFLDLQKAEEQAREARIEAALERVRNAALSLKKSDDMLEISKELYIQLLGLGFNNIRNAIIDIHNDEDETFMDYDYSHEMSGTVTLMSYYDDPIITEQVRKIESSNDAFFELILEGQTLQDLIDVRRNNGEADDERLLNIDQLSYNLYSFGNGAIGISNFGILNDEEKDILKRFTTVFTFAYQRFLDLQEKEIQSRKLSEEKLRLEETLADLQETQQQLIQSEKMASLGELTAGIAHEIQNPLNFVNNFSEVSQELLEEMLEELENGDIEEVKAIIKDITQNLEKINHHGKRADGIVKGMLQHSRSGSGKKEPTDINKLTDEYLRLAYHGLRAKDKSFNAELQTDFDKSIGMIPIIAQEIGRVILNLFTNAFYAVHEKRKSETSSIYKPSVSVKTMKGKDAIRIEVSDNGSGIPKTVIDKIFEPFFTTKPTGQGTGLGLSMSYDIITKGHGGNLQVESKVGVGTSFTITLPTKIN